MDCFCTDKCHEQPDNRRKNRDEQTVDYGLLIQFSGKYINIVIKCKSHVSSLREETSDDRKNDRYDLKQKT